MDIAVHVQLLGKLDFQGIKYGFRLNVLSKLQISKGLLYSGPHNRPKGLPRGKKLEFIANHILCYVRKLKVPFKMRNRFSSYE